MESQEVAEVQENQQLPQEENELKGGGQSSGKKKKKPFLTILIIFLIIALLGGGAWFILSSPEKSSDSSASVGSLFKPESNVSEDVPSPTSTPTPMEVDRAAIKIEILNGTGISGEATLVKEELKKLGYEDIEVGNADNQDQEETTVIFSSELPETFVEEFIDQLEDIYTEVSSSTSTSMEDFDIQIIAGMRSSYTPAPTKASEPTVTPTPGADTTETPIPTVTETPTPTPKS